MVAFGCGEGRVGKALGCDSETTGRIRKGDGTGLKRVTPYHGYRRNYRRPRGLVRRCLSVARLNVSRAAHKSGHVVPNEKGPKSDVLDK